MPYLYFDGLLDQETNEPINGYMQCLLGKGLTINGQKMVILYQGSVTYRELDGEGKVTVFLVDHPEQTYLWHGQFVGGEMGAAEKTTLPDDLQMGCKKYIEANSRNFNFESPSDDWLLQVAIDLEAQSRFNPRPMLLVQSLTNLRAYQIENNRVEQASDYIPQTRYTHT